MNKKIYKYIIGIIVCLLLSILTEIIGFNFKAITSSDEKFQDVTFSESHNGDETTLKLSTDNR